MTTNDTMLDARRRAGETLKEMQERGELATKKAGRPKVSQAATLTRLEDIGLTRSQSARYQAEANVPEETGKGDDGSGGRGKKKNLMAAGPQGFEANTSRSIIAKTHGTDGSGGIGKKTSKATLPVLAKRTVGRLLRKLRSRGVKRASELEGRSR